MKNYLIFTIALVAILTPQQTHGFDFSAINSKGLQLLQLKSEYVVDDILETLKDFKEAIEKEISDIDVSVELEITYLEKLISDYETQKKHQQERCDVIDGEVALAQKEFDKVAEFIRWIKDRMERDKDLIENLHRERCISHWQWIEFMKENKITLNFLQFIRKALENYQMIQMDTVMKIFAQFMTTDKMHRNQVLEEIFNEINAQIEEQDLQSNELKESSFLQEPNAADYHVDTSDSLGSGVRSRTASEQGDGHIDMERERIAVDAIRSGQPSRTIQQYKEELIALLDALEQEIHQDMDLYQAEEIELNGKVVDFTSFLDREIQSLEVHLEEWEGGFDKYEEKLDKALARKHHCDGETALIQCSIDEVTEILESYKEDKESYREHLVEELGELEEIANIYASKIANVADLFKDHYDDYIAEANFDRTKAFDTRELKDNYGELQDEQPMDEHLNDLAQDAIEDGQTIDVDEFDINDPLAVEGEGEGEDEEDADAVGSLGGFLRYF